jgi:hypothetical protein
VTYRVFHIFLIIPGVFNFWTDVQVLSVDESLAFGEGNIGKEGVKKFIEGHSCNEYCDDLGISEKTKSLNVVGAPPTRRRKRLIK